MGILVGIPSLIWFGFNVYDRYCTYADLKCEMTKYDHPKAIFYAGKIVNNSMAHAEEVTFKGEFVNGSVVDMKVYSSVDMINARDIEFGSPDYHAAFLLKRLTKKSALGIEIIVMTKSEVQENIHVSWKNRDHLSIVPIPADRVSMRQFESMLSFHDRTDPSFNARVKRFLSNTKGIRK